MFPICAALALTTLTAAPAPPPPAIPDGDYAELLRVVPPAEGEDSFADIPWLVSLWDAREKAAKEGKPILLWEMDGHPLGCG